MHKIIVALFLIFVFGQKAYSSGIILNPDSKGIDITITSLDAASVKAPGQDSLNALTINNTAYAVPVINGEYLTDEVQFIIAVPENIYYSNDKIKPEIKTGDPEDLNLPYPGLNEHYDNHSTTDYYYLFNPKSNPNGLNPYVYIKKLGIQRGLPLIAVNFQPFYFNPAEDKLSLYDDFRIRIDFGEKIGIVQNGLSPLQKDLYGSVVNKENIVPILDKRSPLAYKENSNKTQEEVWYDPAKTYVKLITTKDRIAVADASGIVSTEPSLRGKSLSGFHLIHNGVEVPIYFLNDNDGILNSGDRIIFIADRNES